MQTITRYTGDNRGNMEARTGFRRGLEGVWYPVLHEKRIV